MGIQSEPGGFPENESTGKPRSAWIQSPGLYHRRRRRARKAVDPVRDRSDYLTMSTEISTAGMVPLFSSQCEVLLSSGQPTPGP